MAAALSANEDTEQQAEDGSSTARRNVRANELASADRHDPSSMKGGMRAALGRRHRPNRGPVIVHDWDRPKICGIGI